MANDAVILGGSRRRGDMLARTQAIDQFGLIILSKSLASQAIDLRFSFDF